ncbi:hypothetical protein M0802_014392 [Mischocyttarus mexicanus]|nr:hypothetical protein M0802_014392 [Mischocyttarus mexicanus]
MRSQTGSWACKSKSRMPGRFFKSSSGNGGTDDGQNSEGLGSYGGLFHNRECLMSFDARKDRQFTDKKRGEVEKR